MADDGKSADRGGSHPAEPAKPDVNRVAEMVRPLPAGHEAERAAESKSFAELIGLTLHSPGLDDHDPVRVADEEKKSWEEKVMERRGQAGTSGSGGNWTERARILPVEQKQEQEQERER